MAQIGGAGHTFGVRVDGTSSRGLWPPAGGGLCRRVMKEKVLRIDRPEGRRVLKFDGAFGPEGCGIALSGDEYEVSVTDLPFCIIRYDRHSADWLAALATPFRLRRTSPYAGGRIKHRESFSS